MFSSSLQRIKRLWREWPYLSIGMLVAILALLGGCFYLQSRGPSVTPGITEIIEATEAAESGWPVTACCCCMLKRWAACAAS